MHTYALNDSVLFGFLCFCSSCAYIGPPPAPFNININPKKKNFWIADTPHYGATTCPHSTTHQQTKWPWRTQHPPHPPHHPAYESKPVPAASQSSPKAPSSRAQNCSNEHQPQTHTSSTSSPRWTRMKPLDDALQHPRLLRQPKYTTIITAIGTQISVLLPRWRVSGVQIRSGS